MATCVAYGNVRFICSVSLSWSLLTHNKDLEVQAEKHVNSVRTEPVGFVAQGWRQVVWQEVVPAGRYCGSARIDLVVSPPRDGGKLSLQAGEISSEWQQFWVEGNFP